MRRFLSCIVLGAIFGMGAGPVLGQGPSRDEVKKVEAELARLQAQLKDLESRLETKPRSAGKGATPKASASEGRTAKRAVAPAAPTRGRAPMAPRGMAFGWQHGRMAPQAAHHAHGYWAAGRGRGGFQHMAGGRGQWAAGRGHGGWSVARGRGFQAPARGHMSAGHRGFAFGFPGHAQAGFGRHFTPPARTKAPAPRTPAARTPVAPAKPEPAPRRPGGAPASSASDADRRLERILREVEELRNDLKKKK